MKTERGPGDWIYDELRGGGRSHREVYEGDVGLIRQNDAGASENITPDTAEAFTAVRLALKSLLADAIASSRAAGNIIEDNQADDIISLMERLETGIAAENEAMDALLRRMAAV